MGIYVFNREVLVKLLDNNLTDFGKHIIPDAIKTHRVFSYVFQGYWEDIGTIRAFFEANLDVTCRTAALQFLRHERAHLHARRAFCPARRSTAPQIDHAVISDGCIINHARITNTIIGIRSLVGAGSELEPRHLLGCDYYESHASILRQS